MGKAFVSTRKELANRLARVIQYVAGAVACSLTLTWADENNDTIEGDTLTTTVYGETSKGKPLGSLPGDLPQMVALGHLREVANQGLNQAHRLEEQVAAAKAGQQPKEPVEVAPEGTPDLEGTPDPDQDIVIPLEILEAKHDGDE